MMVVPYLVGGAIGALGGALGGMLAKPEQKTETYITKKTSITDASSRVYHAPYENYQPTISYGLQYNVAPTYSIIYESPHSTIDTKKEATSAQDVSSIPTMTPYYSISPFVQPSMTDSTRRSDLDLTKIAIIGAIALIGYGLVSK